MKLTAEHDEWLSDVKNALASINMLVDDWQKTWAFDFRQEFESRTSANDAAMKANQFWWHQQNKSVNRDCRLTQNCWLPSDHEGKCQPRS